MKQQIINKINLIFEERIRSINRSINSAKESRDNETKSSVGDKYETGRAMMQMELDKNRIQLNKTESLKHELSKINIQKKYDKVEFGCLVETNRGNYFIFAAFGKININTTEYYCISLSSPIGQLLKNKKPGDCFRFLTQTYTIINIL